MQKLLLSDHEFLITTLASYLFLAADRRGLKHEPTSISFRALSLKFLHQQNTSNCSKFQSRCYLLFSQLSCSSQRHLISSMPLPATHLQRAHRQHLLPRRQLLQHLLGHVSFHLELYPAQSPPDLQSKFRMLHTQSSTTV